MKIENVRYYWNQGYPTMAATIDGRPAIFGVECKPGPYAAGLVCLGGNRDFEAILPPIELDNREGQINTLRGFSDDKELFELYRQFREASFDEFNALVDQTKPPSASH